ncbi:hypothetical protein AB6F62_11230 [Providencia huaxiensis]|uniref:hypothetical protein n=1 Tax=Providencia huaxiensis TaxID=2027290 RepID=UPI0034DD3D74
MPHISAGNNVEMEVNIEDGAENNVDSMGKTSSVKGLPAVNGRVLTPLRIAKTVVTYWWLYAY